MIVLNLVWGAGTRNLGCAYNLDIQNYQSDQRSHPCADHSRHTNQQHLSSRGLYRTTTLNGLRRIDDN